MTAENFVKQKYPNVFAQKIRLVGIRKSYMGYIINIDEGNHYFVDGKTESSAWVAAKKRIIENEGKKY